MKRWYFLPFILLSLLVIPKYAGALDSTLQLKILPINCIFETVNDGSNVIHYLTPEACGQLVDTPSASQPPADIRASIPPFFTTTLNDQRLNGQTNNPEKNIYLNNFSEYRNNSGKQLNLSLGQVVYFDVKIDESLERHSITLKEIGSNYIVITVASTPFDSKIYVNEIKQYDVINDHKNDIEITVNSIKNNFANITFKQLTTTASQSSIDPGYDESRQVQPYILIGILLVGTAILFANRNRSKLFK